MLLTSKKITLFFLTIVFLLVTAHMMGVFSKLVLGHEYVFGLVPLFNMGIEKNVPSTYSSLAILFCAVLLFLITMRERKNGESDFRYWAGLALLFLFLAIDEFISIHEHITDHLKYMITNPESANYSLIIPLGVLTIVFLIIYLNFFKRIPKRTKTLLIAAGILYVFAALGFEIIEEIHTYFNGKENALYCFICTIEETLEMLAIVLFIYTLTSNFEKSVKEFKFLNRTRFGFEASASAFQTLIGRPFNKN